MCRIFFLFVFVFSFSMAEMKGLIDKSDEVFNTQRLQDVEVASKPIFYSNGILFTFDSKTAKSVVLSGDFINWSKVKLVKDLKNVFVVFIDKVNLPKGQYRYRYLVDDFWLDDPLQDYYLSEHEGYPITGFELDQDYERFDDSPEGIGSGYFRFYLKDQGYKNVSWVGTANNWDPYVRPMKRKRGFWMLLIHIDKDKTFYKFCVDGRVILDPINKNVTFNESHEEVNFIPSGVVEENMKAQRVANPLFDVEAN